MSLTSRGQLMPKCFLFLDTPINGIIFLSFFGLLVSRNAAGFCVDFVFGTCLLGLTIYVKCMEFSSYLTMSSVKRDNLASFFPIWILFRSFLPSLLRWNLRMVLSRSGRSRQ